jgi:cysteine desulfurase
MRIKDRIYLDYTARANRGGGNHIIANAIEHPSVPQCCKFLQTKQGSVDPAELKEKISADTILVSVMMANNETRHLLPFKKIASILADKKIIFHANAMLKSLDIQHVR